MPYCPGNSDIKRITYRNADGTVAGTLTASRAKSSKKKSKKLEYNFNEVAARILNAKTSGNARSAVIMARSRTAMLRKKLKSGEYDSAELESAILHAQQMERAARKRQKHLQQEERAERTNGTDPMLEKWQEEFEEESQEKYALPEGLEEAFGKAFEPDGEVMEQLMQELQELMGENVEILESAELSEELGGIEELSEEMLDWEDMEPEDLELRKKKHRAEELKDIVEVNMKYLKALFDRLEKGQNCAVSGNVSLQLGGMEMPVTVTETPVMTQGGQIDISL